ncbi:MAG: NifB/NifX family molybdenum-iron cluster-binding protein [Desulfobacterales bacterium]|nr:NifB/NifX family molybdenum-iron cluster-binding protein [Desulfobacterales bacterium]
MKVAFATWSHRISPVFDVARQVHIVEVDAGGIVGESMASLDSDISLQKALRLAELGVSVLVCGAISRPVRRAIEGYGIDVMSFVVGDLQEVISAWQAGTLGQDRFIMPGCRGGTRGRGPDPVP